MSIVDDTTNVTCWTHSKELHMHLSYVTIYINIYNNLFYINNVFFCILYIKPFIFYHVLLSKYELHPIAIGIGSIKIMV